MKTVRITSIVLGLCLVSSCLAQLTFYNDPLSNSFTLKTPGSQQSFTRYFGGKKRANLIQSPLRQQPQLQYQSQFQPQYQSQLRQQLQTQQLQPQQLQYSPYAQYQPYRQPLTAQPQYFPRSQPGYPFEAAYEQPLQQEETYSQVQQQQQQQYVPQSYRGAEYSMPISQAQAQAAGAGAAGLPSYGEQAQQGIESYQQEQQQIQQIMQQQQQQQQQLLLDLYKTPLGQGRAHQDVYRQQQNVSDRGYGFSPMSMYTNGVPTSAYGGFGNSTPLNYSPSSNVSSVSYSNGKLSYNY